MGVTTRGNLMIFLIGGETTRVCGAKRLGLKIEAKRLGGKRLVGKRLGGETSCETLDTLRKLW